MTRRDLPKLSHLLTFCTVLLYAHLSGCLTTDSVQLASRWDTLKHLLRRGMLWDTRRHRQRSTSGEPGGPACCWLFVTGKNF